MASDALANRIGRLRLRGPYRDGPALRMQVSRALASLDLRPSGMSPSAILYVRRLEARMPAEAVTVAAWRAAGATWQSALRDQIERAYRSAQRPAAGSVTHGAHAVLFRDRGERSACLCRDVLQGAVAGKWWWTENHGLLFYALPRSAALRSVLSAEPHCLPAVFEQLADWKLAIRVVELLEDADADTLNHALLVEFSCPRLLDKLQEATPAPREADNTKAAADDTGRPSLAYRSWFADGSDRRFLSQGHVDRPVRGFTMTQGASEQNTYPPWLPLFRDQVWERRLTRSQACLLGLARTAFTRPALLRNTAFENQVASWWSAESTVGPAVPVENAPELRTLAVDPELPPARVAGESPRIAPPPERVEPSSTDFALDEGGDTPLDGASSMAGKRPRPSDTNGELSDFLASVVRDPGTGAATLVDGETRLSATLESDSDLAPWNDEAGEGLDGAANDSIDHADVRSDGQVTAGDDPDEISPKGTDESRPNWLTGNYVDTELGGLFYLINLLEQLELPEAMDVDWHFDARLGRWGFLELIALGLLNESLEGLKDDPLWHLLAKLSGRKPGSPIGERYLSDFVPDFRLPPDWWKHLISAVDRSVHLWWAVQADRMRIWCDECVLVDHAVGSDGPPHPDGLLASVQAELRPYQQGGEALPIGSGPFDRAPWERPSDALVRAAGAPLCRWVSMAMPFLRWFLQRQLHLDSATGDRLMETLLGLPARIYFTPSHVDMVADVNLTSLAIRRSGLDQDPGWQPLYGRVLLFHFAQV
jgi:hypothetical protein